MIPILYIVICEFRSVACEKCAPTLNQQASFRCISGVSGIEVEAKEIPANQPFVLLRRVQDVNSFSKIDNLIDNLMS